MIPHFKKGDLLKATQLNELSKRIARLEKLTTNGLISNVTHDGITAALPNNIPDIQFILTNEEVIPNQTVLYEGVILDQDDNGNFFATSDIIYFRNIFGCSLNILSRALVIKFPRGNGEWLWIPKACEQALSSG
jgi:hypothetical protein